MKPVQHDTQSGNEKSKTGCYIVKDAIYCGNMREHVVLSTYILSLLNDVSSSELASATLSQNFSINLSLFSVTTNIRDRRLFITPSSSSKKENNSDIITKHYAAELSGTVVK